jgi:EAL domain-containing protein (putative c-di-GMP-specific phosphodiesterase class I)
MCAAKEARSGYVIFDASHESADTIRLTLVSELRSAIRGNELVLHYQPKATLATDEIKSVEALVRWQHPTRGLVGPDEFIPVAQQTTLVKPLTLWVLNEAMRQCRAWVDEGLDLSVAVNLSPRNLLDDRFPDDVSSLLARWDLSPARIELEITESAIVSDLRRAKSVLDRLASLGILLSVDDFGTGYSSLSHLKNLPVRELKIDRSFVECMTNDPDDASIVRSTIELAKSLGLTVVAEGVETAETWAELRALGCDRAQGYVLSRPLNPDELRQLLHECASRTATTRTSAA